MHRIARIYILWANKDAALPSELESTSRVTVLHPATSSLNERFNPPADLKTQAVFIADDDLLYPLEDLETAFAAWQSRPFSQVGFWSRMHGYENGIGSYRDDKEQYSSTSTQGAFRFAQQPAY